MAVNCPHCSKDVDGWIPEDRLSEMAKAKREATTTAEKLAGEIEAIRGKAASADNLAVELAEARTHAEKLASSHGQQLSVYRHGITDAEDVADILAIFQRRAPNGTDLGDWLGGDTLPRSVSALMATRSAAPAVAAPAPATTATATGPAPAAAPSPALVPVLSGVATANAGAVPTPPALAQPSANEIASMSVDQYKAHRDTLLAGLT